MLWSLVLAHRGDDKDSKPYIIMQPPEPRITTQRSGGGVPNLITGVWNEKHFLSPSHLSFTFASRGWWRWEFKASLPSYLSLNIFGGLGGRLYWVSKIFLSPSQLSLILSPGGLIIFVKIEIGSVYGCFSFCLLIC